MGLTLAVDIGAMVISINMKSFLFVLTAILLDVVSCGSRGERYEELPYLYVSTDRIVLGNQQGASSIYNMHTDNV